MTPEAGKTSSQLSLKPVYPIFGVSPLVPYGHYFQGTILAAVDDREWESRKDELPCSRHVGRPSFRVSLDSVEGVFDFL